VSLRAWRVLPTGEPMTGRGRMAVRLGYPDSAVLALLRPDFRRRRAMLLTLAVVLLALSVGGPGYRASCRPCGLCVFYDASGLSLTLLSLVRSDVVVDLLDSRLLVA
jgi:hypothetical protein